MKPCEAHETEFPPIVTRNRTIRRIHANSEKCMVTIVISHTANVWSKKLCSMAVASGYLHSFIQHIWLLMLSDDAGVGSI